MIKKRMPVMVVSWLIISNIFNIIYGIFLYPEQFQPGSYLGTYFLMVEMGITLLIAIIFGNLDLKRLRKELWIKAADAQDVSTSEKK